MEGVAAREMRLARLLLISGLAARAGGAEAAADWFPRWASFASDDTPYIHSRGYQTVRTSGSTGAAAAAVLSLCCPISMELMQHPVMAADGNTYDRSSIEDWFSLGKKTSPLTGAPLAHLGLTPNNLVRSMVSEYRDASSRA